MQNLALRPLRYDFTRWHATTETIMTQDLQVNFMAAILLQPVNPFLTDGLHANVIRKFWLQKKIKLLLLPRI